MRPTVLTVTLNPAIDQTLTFDHFDAGAVNRVKTSQSHAGGKGVNVAAVLAKLGADVTATGWLGEANAAIFEKLFADHGIADRFQRVPGETRIGLKISDESNGDTTDINFPGLTISHDAVDVLLHTVERLVTPGMWVVLAGSVPAGVEPAIYGRLIDAARAKGGLVAIDTSGKPFHMAIEYSPDVVKPNVDELSEAVGRPLTTIDDIVFSARALVERGIRVAAVSMGGDGALFVDANQVIRTRPPAVEVRSTVGAGDAMAAGIVFGLANRMTLTDTAKLATALGTDAVTRVGRDGPLGYERFLTGIAIETIAGGVGR